MNKIPIIYYHSIAPEKNSKWYKSYLTYELSYFEDLLKYLSSSGFQFLFLDEYFILKNDKNAKNNKLICLTFDDGYLDNFVYVFPLLKKYKAKGTIFVSTDFVRPDNKINNTLEDVWSGKIKSAELSSLGYLSYEEMKIMEKSGLVDIQSHTVTHTKNFISDKIRDFHNPKADYLYPISNLFPERKANYITDDNFKNLIPFGTPFFEEKSAIVSKKVFINNDFNNECVHMLKNLQSEKYSFSDTFEKIRPLYEDYRNKNNLILDIENQADYEKRVRYEIKYSKEALEKKLGNKINHVCWPHGDYNDFCHQVAIEEGYSSSHIVLKKGGINNSENRFDRIATGSVKNNQYLTLLKAKYKIRFYRNIFPYNGINQVYKWVK